MEVKVQSALASVLVAGKRKRRASASLYRLGLDLNPTTSSMPSVYKDSCPLKKRNQAKVDRKNEEMITRELNKQTQLPMNDASAIMDDEI